jgi:hypothetical protein
LPDLPELPAEGHASVILDLINALEEGRDPLSVNSDNIRSLAMVFAAIENASRGHRIEFTPNEQGKGT